MDGAATGVKISDWSGAITGNSTDAMLAETAARMTAEWIATDTVNTLKRREPALRGRTRDVSNMRNLL
jgi:hypothetical protein